MIELILAIRMAMHEHRQIALGKRGLLACNRIKRDAGFGDDLVTIPAPSAPFVREPQVNVVFQSWS
jgi:hypothetical protein